MEITELILELRIIYDTAPDRFSYLQLPCTVPTATPYAGAGHLAAPRVAPPPKTTPAPLVLPQPTFSGAPELATPPPFPLLRAPRGWPPCHAPSPRPPLASRPAPAAPSSARPPPPSGPIKGRAQPLARAQQGRRPSPPLPDAAGAPWSRRSAPPRLQ